MMSEKGIAEKQADTQLSMTTTNNPATVSDKTFLENPLNDSTRALITPTLLNITRGRA